MLRLLGKTIVWLLALVVLLAAVAGGHRWWRQQQAERALAVDTRVGVDEGMFVSVGRGEQWVTLRGKDRRNPVLLIVHGGPGTALSPLATSFLPYERDWTVVQWDQPGAGKTFGRAGGVLDAATSVTSIAADGIAVTEFVAARLGSERVVVLGLSFGSVVALEMARARPDLYTAYVGTGLFVHRDDGRVVAYQRVLAEARARESSEATAALEAIGPPPYTTAEDARTLNRWIRELLDDHEASAAGRLAEIWFAPRQSFRDFASYFGGYAASDAQFDLGAMDLRTSGVSFALPIVVIHGARDLDTPVELARNYFESITAPHKSFVTLPNGGHTALVYDQASFSAALHEHVLPLVGAAVR